MAGGQASEQHRPGAGRLPPAQGTAHPRGHRKAAPHPAPGPGLAAAMPAREASRPGPAPRAVLTLPPGREVVKAVAAAGPPPRQPRGVLPSGAGGASPPPGPAGPAAPSVPPPSLTLPGGAPRSRLSRARRASPARSKPPLPPHPLPAPLLSGMVRRGEGTPGRALLPKSNMTAPASPHQSPVFCSHLE